MDLGALRLKKGITRGWHSTGRFLFVHLCCPRVFPFFRSVQTFFFLLCSAWFVYDLVSFLTILSFSTRMPPNPHKRSIVVLRCVSCLSHSPKQNLYRNLRINYKYSATSMLLWVTGMMMRPCV